MKYFLKEIKREVSVGDHVTLSKRTKTPYGFGKITVETELTEPLLEKLIKDGLIIAKEDKPITKNRFIDSMRILCPYIRVMARELDLEISEACLLLSAIAGVSLKTHLEMLIEAIAKVKNKGKTFGKASYYLSPVDNYKPTQTTFKSKGLTRFADIEDAEAAYELLKVFIEDIVNGE